MSGEPSPSIDERIAELEALNKTREEITLTLYNEGYSTSEIMKHRLPLKALKGVSGKKAVEPTEAVTVEEENMFEERTRALEEEGKTNKEMCLILDEEGFNSTLIIGRFGGAYAAAKREQKKALESREDAFQAAITGGPSHKTTGYIDDLRAMIQRQISRSRELTEVFYNIGLGTLLASLRKSGIGIEEFRRIALKQEGLREALETAGETAFKALEYYNSDLIGNVERERDEARAYASLLEVQLDTVKRNLDPKVRLEKMIYNLVLLSGSVKVDPNALLSLVDKWLSLEVIAA